RGAIASPMAEQVMCFIFALAKNVPHLLENKRHKQWERFMTMELYDRTVGIIGLGAVGGQVTRLAKGIGMRVIATEMAATRQGSNIWGVDELYPGHALLEMLPESDFVVVSAPLTTETRAMIGEKELRAMKPTAFLINVARGKLINEPVLIKALKEGWIAGAGLDVFETEPLPADSELWELPNVILSSHSSGSTANNPKLVGLFCQNLRRYLAGKQLINVVDKEKGF
ncbi:D-2-hydroxyacid dehydrogenase, partial [Chloroflexota bacterium]